MRAFRGGFFLGTLLLLTSLSSTQAAWNNVFQVTCFRSQSSVRAYSPGCPDPCPPACPPQPVCTTRYVQRSYYQPVVTMKRQVSYTPVTTYRRSYYYEPVTRYRYSCAYDPCTCSYKQVATPVTSYRLRSRCCPVTSYLQRCQMVPVTSYRKVCYYEPVTSCSDPCPTTTPATTTQPGVGEEKTGGEPPRVGEQRIPPSSGTSRFPSLPRTPEVKENSRRYLPPINPPVRKPAPQPRVDLDRVTSLQKCGHNVEGRVVESNYLPRARAEVLFVNADRQGVQKSTTADSQGWFRADLSVGNWLVYVQDAEGRPSYLKKIEVGTNQTHRVSLVSR